MEIIDWRQDVVNVPKITLIKDYNDCFDKGGYSFLGILSNKEKIEFIKHLDSTLVDHCYKTRSIKTTDWVRILRILESCGLENDYYIYRRAYWGECAGRTKNDPSYKVASVVLMRIVFAAAATTPKKRVNVLIENNRVSRIQHFSQCPWSNRNYILDETEADLS